MSNKIIICKECKRTIKHSAHGLCHNCYLKSRPKITCKVCGRKMIVYLDGMCKNCHTKLQPKITCVKCGRVMDECARGLCFTCYRHTKYGKLSLYENKSCSSYLGIVVGERLLANYFEGVTRMPYAHKGFDFTCTNGYKIDSKIATARIDKRVIMKSNHWTFGLHKNSIADYFCCIAIDQRGDLSNLNIIKAWLIPRNAVSVNGINVHELNSLTISLSNVSYWEQYEIDDNELNECCRKLIDDNKSSQSELYIVDKKE